MPPAYGLSGTDEWFRELGRLTGKEVEVEVLIKEERARIEPELKELREKLNEFKNLSKSTSAKVLFETDSGVIKQRLREYNHNNHTPLILGSSWDRDIVSELNGFWLNISLPVLHRLVMERSYVGYSGGLRLAEDIYGSILETYK